MWLWKTREQGKRRDNKEGTSGNSKETERIPKKTKNRIRS